MFRDFCSAQKMDLYLIATGASRANGQVERVMSTLKSLLTVAETGQGTLWVRFHWLLIARPIE